MCFSAEASFTVGGLLIPAGAFCVWASLRKKPSYLGLAIVPAVFGIQQISEGFVWLAKNQHPSETPVPESLVFLFFALAFWPFWFPALSIFMEPQRWRKLLFVVFALLASSWFWILYYPLLMDPSILTTRVEHHSLQYDYFTLPVYSYVPRLLLQVLYLLSVALPMALGSESWGRIPGLVLGASAVLSALVFHYAFVSVWCFFAAVLAIYLCWVFYRLPSETEALVK